MLGRLLLARGPAAPWRGSGRLFPPGRLVIEQLRYDLLSMSWIYTEPVQQQLEAQESSAILASRLGRPGLVS